MLEKEAKWIGAKLNANPDHFPLLNVGSQTEYFRKILQPHIHEYIFGPALEKGQKVVHTDLQDAEGVDIVGDLCDPAFLEKLKSQSFQSVLCSNLLEHVNEAMRSRICVSLLDVIEPGGVLLLTVPRDFPYHPDPIDTYFRPSPEELASYFPDCELIESEIIEGDNYFSKWKRDPKKLGRVLLRVCLPFYKFDCWKGVVHQFLWIFKPVRITVIQLRKKSLVT